MGVLERLFAEMQKNDRKKVWKKDLTSIVIECTDGAKTQKSFMLEYFNRNGHKTETKYYTIGC